jgi:3-hexulose-6-phosphate synthase/6-phospho-3-hexuloisomerase
MAIVRRRLRERGTVTHGADVGFCDIVGDAGSGHRLGQAFSLLFILHSDSAMKPTLQLALDFVNLDQALRVAREATNGGVERLEAGTPLIKSEGLKAVRALRSEFPSATIVADMKVMDAGRVETAAAAKAGADIVHVLGVASDSTVKECIEAARRYDASICVDLVGFEGAEVLADRARQAEELGAAAVCVHTPIDQQMRAEAPFEDLRAVVAAVSIPVAVAGGINSETVPEAARAGAGIIVVGGAITKSPDATEATRSIIRAIETGVPEETELYKRGGEEEIADVLARTSAADVTMALHNQGVIAGIEPIVEGSHVAGPALTVWTYPGDWAKPVEAIDHAERGQVLVIDAGGRSPAVWGEMASMSCQQRGVAGVVIYGGIRDTMNIRELKFPAFSSLVTPVAGEPRGQGMIDVPLHFGGQRIRTGDWIVGDDDGVVVIPQEKAVEVANRAQSVVEEEDREMAEIEEGSTLGEVSELARWEQLRKGNDERNE